MTRPAFLLIGVIVAAYALFAAPEFVIGTAGVAAVFVFGTRWFLSTMFRRSRGVRR